MQNNKLLPKTKMSNALIFLIMSALFVLGGCGAQEPTISDPLPLDPSFEENTGEDQGMQTLPADFKRYDDEELGFGFALPEGWGEISKREEMNHRSLSLEGGSVFLGADNGGENVGRGGYWGDSAELITDQDYITKLCETKTDAKSCEIRTNDAGLTYAKVTEDIVQFGPSVEGINYYIFNPNNDYRGIILSTERLDEDGYDRADLQYIVDNFYFL